MGDELTIDIADEPQRSAITPDAGHGVEDANREIPIAAITATLDRWWASTSQPGIGGRFLWKGPVAPQRGSSGQDANDPARIAWSSTDGEPPEPGIGVGTVEPAPNEAPLAGSHTIVAAFPKDRGARLEWWRARWAEVEAGGFVSASFPAVGDRADPGIGVEQLISDIVDGTSGRVALEEFTVHESEGGHGAHWTTVVLGRLR